MPPRYTTLDGPYAGRTKSCGLAAHTAEVKIVDENRREVPRGTIGEVAAKGPMIMLGYWNRPRETAAVLQEICTYFPYPIKVWLNGHERGVIGGQRQVLALTHPGSSEELDGQLHERVVVGAGGLQQLGRRRVVKEAGQGFVGDGHVGGQHWDHGGRVGDLPFEQSGEEPTQRAEPVLDGVAMQPRRRVRAGRRV